MMQPKKKRPGPKNHEPTEPLRQTVSLHAMVGTPQETIADIIGIDSKTLRKYYRVELDQALAKANATIGGALFNKAKNGDTAAQTFWLKTRAGFREQKVEENRDVQPLEISFNVSDAVAEVKTTNAK